MIAGVAVVVAGVVAGVVASLVPPAAPCYRPPVDASVVVPFVMPACRYCPGHRGLEYHLAVGTLVRAVAPGVVSFAGQVAGVRYVIVQQPDGLRATYGMLGETRLVAGGPVGAGQVVGTSSTRLYFGLRATDGSPVDPTALLGRALGRPRLAPIDGTPARPSGRTLWSCVDSPARPP